MEYNRFEFRFSLFYTGCLTQANEPSLIYYLSIAGGRRDWFISFSWALVQSKILTTLLRIWTQISSSISYENNCYTTCIIHIHTPSWKIELWYLEVLITIYVLYWNPIILFYFIFWLNQNVHLRCYKPTFCQYIYNKQMRINNHLMNQEVFRCWPAEQYKNWNW